MKHDGFYPHVSSNLDRFLSIVSAGCNSGTIWQEQGFCLVFIRKAWLFNTHLFVRKWKHLHISLSSPKTSLTKATRFFISHLFFLFSASSHLSPSLIYSPPTHAVFSQGPESGGWYHLTLLLSQTQVRASLVPAFLGSAYFWFWAEYQVKCPQQPWLCPPGVFG